MKTGLFVLCLCMAQTIQPTRGQSVRDTAVGPRNVVKFNPLSLALGHVSAFYERAITRQITLVGGLGFGGETYRYAYNSTIVPSPGRFHYERLTLEGRYYLNQFRAPVGVYLGPYVRYARLSMNNYLFDAKGAFLRDQAGALVKEERRMGVLIPGFIGGVQLPIGRHLTFELFMGLQYQLPGSSKPYSPAVAEGMSTAGFSGRVGLTAGWRF